MSIDQNNFGRNKLIYSVHLNYIHTNIEAKQACI